MKRVRNAHERRVQKCLQELRLPYEYEEEYFEVWLPQPKSMVCAECGSEEVDKQAWYLPDFVLGNVILEPKGKWTAQGRKKMKAFVEQWPDLRLIMIFQYDNWLTKSHKGKYSTWCEANGIEYFVARKQEDILRGIQEKLGGSF